MAELPAGTVTLLFTDIEGSTRLLQQLGERYAALLADYRQILRDMVVAAGGHEVDTQGDALFAAFPRARAALVACLAAQRALATHAWRDGLTVRARMALHTGEPQLTGAGYVGLDVHRAARLCSAAHGGQVLISATTQALVAHDLPPGLSLRDLGTHRLKDLREPKRIFQLVASDLPADFPPLRTLLSTSHNLPPQPTPFVGREREIAALRRRLLEPDVRLLTLTGVGGTGKTRLAIRVGGVLHDVFADGVHFVNLASICDASLVAPAIAQTLGVGESGGQFTMEGLTAYLRDRHILLLLDNFEQVTAAAPLIAELLATARQLKVIVTSREVLHLADEYEFPVPPLELPDPKQLPALQAISQYEAVALFIQRAQAVKPDFQVTNVNAPAVAEICIRLDGLPLAIELAAARSKVLPPHALLERLNSRLKLLTGGARDLPARQQTLRGAIDWSYDLLDQSERTFFRRLSVFVGSSTLEAVETVCAIDGDLGFNALDGMQSLMDKSLLRPTDYASGEPRFAMFDTIREYAFERLQESSEFEELARRHAMYYLRHAEATKPATDGADLAAWLRCLDRELANLRAALDWMLGRNETELALRLFATLQPFCRGHADHGEDVCRSGACTICQTVFRGAPRPRRTHS